MTSTKMRVRTTMAVALAGMAAVLGLLVSPAQAQLATSGPGTSGGALATNDSVASGTCVATADSVCSGSGRASIDSTSSGSAVAVDGSVSSGCATAINDSTASGAPCPPAGPSTTVTTRPGTPPGGGTPTTVRTAGAATATGGARLALTGSTTTEMAGMALMVLALGGMLVLIANRRPAEG